MFDKKNILNVDVLSLTRQELLDNLKEGVLITPNVDHLVKLQKDIEFYECYQKAEWVVCDSKILFLSMKLLGNGIPEPIPGSSFFTSFYEYHKYDKDCKIFLLGAMDGVALKAMEKINKRMGRDMVVGALSPSYGFEKKLEENEEIHKIINESGANVVLVGVGAPKQEKWIMGHKDKMPGVKIWMALGATIDFEAGNVRRAPKIMQDMALEWLFRMWCDPKRMFKRYICDDLVFFVYLVKQMFGKYRDPFISLKKKVIIKDHEGREIGDKIYGLDNVLYSLHEIGKTLNGYQMHEVIKRANAALPGNTIIGIHFYEYTGKMEHLKMLVRYADKTNKTFRDLSDSEFDTISRIICDVFAERNLGNFFQRWRYKKEG